MGRIKRSSAVDFDWGRLLGRGSFGTVYEVNRRCTGRKYVIKCCDVRRMGSVEQQEAIGEVHLLASLRHQYIVRYHDSFVDGRGLNIVMEFCSGGDLAALVSDAARRRIRLPEIDVRRYTLQITAALGFLHSRKILHRDLKSANVFLAANGDARLGDFGVSKLLDRTSDFAFTKVGTPYFMSPELCENRPYSSKSDIWALGCLVYELCQLHPPFQANNLGSLVMKILHGSFESITTRHYAADIAMLVDACLAQNPEERPSAAQLLSGSIANRWARKLGIQLKTVPKITSTPGIGRGICDNTPQKQALPTPPPRIYNVPRQPNKQQAAPKRTVSTEVHPSSSLHAPAAQYAQCTPSNARQLDHKTNTQCSISRPSSAPATPQRENMCLHKRSTPSPVKQQRPNIRRVLEHGTRRKTEALTKCDDLSLMLETLRAECFAHAVDDAHNLDRVYSDLASRLRGQDDCRTSADIMSFLFSRLPLDNKPILSTKLKWAIEVWMVARSFEVL